MWREEANRKRDKGRNDEKGRGRRRLRPGEEEKRRNGVERNGMSRARKGPGYRLPPRRSLPQIHRRYRKNHLDLPSLLTPFVLKIRIPAIYQLEKGCNDQQEGAINCETADPLERRQFIWLKDFVRGAFARFLWERERVSTRERDSIVHGAFHCTIWGWEWQSAKYLKWISHKLES